VDGKSAGAATNVVTDFATIKGEARSHNKKFVKEIVHAYRGAFARAASKVRDANGRSGKVRFRSRQDYLPFRLSASSAAVRHAFAASERAGLKATLRIANGGLDANWLVRHGIPTVTIGAGQNNIHSIGEYVSVADFLTACRLTLALASPDV
jgi:tripeptide aminopeptidase